MKRLSLILKGAVQPWIRSSAVSTVGFRLIPALGAILTASLITGAASPVLISEFMALNNFTLADEDGSYSDWIEVYNSSTNTVNLAGNVQYSQASREGPDRKNQDCGKTVSPQDNSQVG